MHKGSIYRVLSGSVAYFPSLKRGDGEGIIYTRIGFFCQTLATYFLPNLPQFTYKLLLF